MTKLPLQTIWGQLWEQHLSKPMVEIIQICIYNHIYWHFTGTLLAVAAVAIEMQPVL